MNWADRVYSLGRGVCAIRGEDDLDTRFIRYGLEYRLPALLQLAGGSTFPNLPQDTIKDFEIPFPRNRKRIASILSAYDEAMENNRQRMGLLENAARLLYQEWFVRLRFPGHEHTPVIKDLPKGWEWKPLNAICPDLREAANPTDLEPGTPYIGLEHMPRRSITLLDWGTAEDVTSTKLRYLAGDILFGKIRPYFHKVGFALTDGVTSSDAIVLRPSEPFYYSFALLTVSSDWFVNIVSKTAKEGSKMPRADWNLMEMHSLVVPPRALLETLNETIKPMLDQLRTLALQNLKLRAARELLLPRLMSGEIEV
jgi:type I restriction enzyme S subunit